MEMLKRATEAENKFKHLIDASTDAVEISQLDQLRQYLELLSSDAASTAKKSKALSENKVPLTPLINLKDVQDATEKLANKFMEEPKSSSVFEGKKWSSYNEKTTLALKNAARSVESDWTKYFKSLFGGMTPEQRKSRLILKIPENKIAIDKYTKIYNEFIQHNDQIPDSLEIFQKIHSLVKELSEISMTFKEDVPENVKKFFDQTTFGASLDYLTEDVMAWLRENDMLSSFIVKAKS
ncbi:hypothetical protein G6725_02190 [Polynucleobacter paneuropaeus]|nr:hypothetical protein [Polynucleobacter paneuropaeus]